MTEKQTEFSRVQRKKTTNRSNTILNWLIGIVIVLIGLTFYSLFNQNPLQDSKENSSKDEVTSKESPAGEVVEKAETTLTTEADASSGEEAVNEVDAAVPGTVTYIPSDDEIIKETIINTAWQPIGTEQSGEHVSLYDGKSIDWQEKKKAIAYATGQSEEALIFWKIKNGGSPQKSIGIVSTKDQQQKFRVFLEWIEREGWKPTKVDVLTTLDFPY